MGRTPYRGGSSGVDGSRAVRRALGSGRLWIRRRRRGERRRDSGRGGGGSCELPERGEGRGDPGADRARGVRRTLRPEGRAARRQGDQRGGEILGDSTLVVEYSDTAGNAQTAASQATEAISNDEYVAAFGPVTSGTAVAVAPVAERGKLPIVFSQAGSEGVVIGDYTFRITPPMATYYPKIADYITSEDVKTMSVVYTSDFPTLNGIATETLPDDRRGRRRRDPGVGRRPAGHPGLHRSDLAGPRGRSRT